MLQKRADLIVKNLKILKFNCIYLFQIGKLMGQFKNGLLPQTFDSKFALNSQVHNYDTRSSKLFHIPKIRTNICKFWLRYQGPRFYNSLSSDIQSARTMTSFINVLKTSLIDFWLFFSPICVCVCDYFYIMYGISNDYFVSYIFLFIHLNCVLYSRI